MTNKEAIRRIGKFGVYHAIEDLPNSYQVIQAFKMAIESLEKTADKECSRCIHRNACAIFDNFNIDYCSDWRNKE